MSMRRSRLVATILLVSASLSLAAQNEKRAPSGFQGVRGKKSVEDTYHENSVIDNGGEMDKRVPSSGFMGMRGENNQMLHPQHLDNLPGNTY